MQGLFGGTARHRAPVIRHGTNNANNLLGFFLRDDEECFILLALILTSKVF